MAPKPTLIERASQMLGSHNRLALQALRLGALISVPILLFYYRSGGIADLSRTQISFRDLGPFLDGGMAIINGVNPYDPVLTRGGSAGSLALAVVAVLIPHGLTLMAFQLLNIVGIALFIKNFPVTVSKEMRFTIFLIVVWSAPFRENLSLNQISGIILGLLAFSFNQDGKNHNLIKIVFYRSCFAVALDLKPHLLLPVLITLFIFNYFRKEIIQAIGVLLVFHILIDIRIGSVIEIEYLKLLTNLAGQSTGNNFGDSVTYWPLLRSIGIDVQGVVAGVAVMILAGMLIQRFIKNKNFVSIFGMSMILPTFGSYFHLYDAVGIITITLFFYTSRSRYLLLTILLGSIIMIPIELNSLQNWLIEIFGLILLLAMYKRIEKLYQLTQKSIAGLCLGLSMHLINKEIANSAQEMQVLVTTEIVAIAAALIVLLLRVEADSNVE